MTATVYVDGKNGNDSNPGTLGQPFKTIAQGVTVSTGPGDTVLVVGYTDYIYRERAIPFSWAGLGTLGTPVTISAVGFTCAGGYVKPIVSGAAVVTGTWTQPNAGLYLRVWSIPWPTASMLDSSILTDPAREERIWLNTSIPLRRPVTAPTLSDINANGYSYMFDPSSPGGGVGTLSVNVHPAAGVHGLVVFSDPNGNTIETPYQSTFYLEESNAYITIQGFVVQHGNLGINLSVGCNNNLIQYCDANYNFDFGIGMGDSTGSATYVHDNLVQACTGTGNTLQLVKLQEYARNNTVQYCDGAANYLESGVKLAGPNCHDNLVQHNSMRDGATVPAYTRHSPGSWVVGCTIQDGAQNNTITGNVITNNGVGLNTYQDSSSYAPLSGNTITGNQISGNTEITTSDSGYALVWEDGAGGSSGTGALAVTGNYLYGNGRSPTEVLTGAGVSNKTVSGTITQAPSPALLTTLACGGVAVLADATDYQTSSVSTGDTQSSAVTVGDYQTA